MAADSITVSPAYNGDSVPLTAGMIVRLKPGANNNVVRAQANNSAGIQGVNAIVVSGASAPGTGVLLACVGRRSVQMQSGLTPSVGDTVYVSATTAGRGTNVLPAVVFPVGTVADTTDYARLGTCTVDVNVTAVGVGPPGPTGENAFSTLTAAFTQPNSAANVTVQVDDNGWMVLGQVVFVASGGYYSVQSVNADTIHATIENLGYAGNAAPTTVVGSGGKVSPGGLIGPTGPAVTTVWKFSAHFTIGSGTVFMGDGATGNLVAPSATALAYVPPACHATGMVVNVTASTATGTPTIGVTKNGSLTGLAVNYNAAQTGIQAADPTSVSFNGTTDVLDVTYIPGGSGGAITLSVTVVLSP